MTALRLILSIVLACVCAIAAYYVVPHGVEAEQLLYAQDDPVLLTDHQLARVFNAEVAAREIEAALVLDDADLAQSFLDLARDRNVTIDPALAAKVEAANSTMASTRRAAKLGGTMKVASLTEPAVAVRAAREAVKVEKTHSLMRAIGDVGRVQSKAGTQAALDALKIAQGPRDLSRMARLAEAKGTRTRAIL